MKTIITAKVYPRSTTPGVEKTGVKEYKVRVKAAPDKGRANAEVIDLLAGHFSVPRSCLTIARGHTGRNKIVVIESE